MVWERPQKKWDMRTPWAVLNLLQIIHDHKRHAFPVRLIFFWKIKTLTMFYFADSVHFYKETSDYFELIHFSIKFFSSLLTCLSVLSDIYDTLTLRNTHLSLATASGSHAIIYSLHTSTSKTMYHTVRPNHAHTTLTTGESAPRLFGALLLRNNTIPPPR
jgi:hypothetical protein